jgi:hypothetical protein
MTRSGSEIQTGTVAGSRKLRPAPLELSFVDVGVQSEYVGVKSRFVIDLEISSVEYVDVLVSAFGSNFEGFCFIKHFDSNSWHDVYIPKHMSRIKKFESKSPGFGLKITSIGSITGTNLLQVS